MVTRVLIVPLVGLRPVILGAGGTIVTVEVADFVGSATDVAVTVTEGGFGTAGGAVYEVV